MLFVQLWINSTSDVWKFCHDWKRCSTLKFLKQSKDVLRNEWIINSISYFTSNLINCLQTVFQVRAYFIHGGARIRGGGLIFGIAWALVNMVCSDRPIQRIQTSWERLHLYCLVESYFCYNAERYESMLRYVLWYSRFKYLTREKLAS